MVRKDGLSYSVVKPVASSWALRYDSPHPLESLDGPAPEQKSLGKKSKKTGLTMIVFPRSAILSLLILCTIVGCGGHVYVVPPELEEKLDREATFAKLSESPNAYKGRIVMLTGVVLNINILPKFTRVELLQLPLDSDGVPVTDLNASQGRFLANFPGVIYPQKLPTGTRISVIGEMQGTLRLEDRDYSYITLESKATRVFPQEDLEMLRDPKALWQIFHPTGRFGAP